MEIVKGIHIVDLALCYREYLIISDVQLGYEESLTKQGVLLPKYQLSDVLARLEKILSMPEARGITTVIINGDLKHEFGTISNQEWHDTLKFFDFLTAKNLNVIVVKGNHDLILGPIAAKRNIRIVDELKIGEVLILHGHKVSKTKASVIIIGHEHPAISFPGRKDEKFKCFLLGRYGKSTIIVLPSLNPLVPGSDITQESFLSPYLKKGIDDFEVYVVEDKVYKFGKAKRLLERS